MVKRRYSKRTQHAKHVKIHRIQVIRFKVCLIYSNRDGSDVFLVKSKVKIEIISKVKRRLIRKHLCVIDMKILL